MHLAKWVKHMTKLFMLHSISLDDTEDVLTESSASIPWFYLLNLLPCDPASDEHTNKNAGGKNNNEQDTIYLFRMVKLLVVY